MQEAMFHYPLRQHIGAAGVPVVAAGDTVRRGELLARRPEAGLGVNLFSSVSGTVTAVTADAIPVRAEGAQRDDYVPLQGDTPLRLIEESGLVGLAARASPPGPR